MQLRCDVLDGVRLAAVLDDRDGLVALYARPDDDRAWLGDQYQAQVTRFAPAQRAYFLDLGGEEAFLPVPAKEAELKPGQKITIQIERPATRDKKIRCTLIKDTASGDLGRIASGPDLSSQALHDYPELTILPLGLEDFDAQIYALMEPCVTIQEGVEIVIDPVTALTAIDVNNADPTLTPLEVNRLAAYEIARQLRLRNIGGQVLVDFLRLRDPKHREALENSLQQAITHDPNPVHLYGFTRLGLFELTRTKKGLALNEIFSLTRN